MFVLPDLVKWLLCVRLIIFSNSYTMVTLFFEQENNMVPPSNYIVGSIARDITRLLGTDVGQLKTYLDLTTGDTENLSEYTMFDGLA